MPTSSEEQYLKTIYTLSLLLNKLVVPMKDIAARMAVSSGTVTSMAKNLDQQNLVDYFPQKGCQLTASGKQIALGLLRRHRLIEAFLFKILRYSRSRIHEEAEILEHAVSDYFIEQLDALLDFPAEDPHGDPIPTKSGKIIPQKGVLLSTLASGKHGVVQRLIHIDTPTMSYLEQKQLVPGVGIQVIENDSIVQIVTLVHSKTNASISLPFEIAKEILVTPSNTP